MHRTFQCFKYIANVWKKHFIKFRLFIHFRSYEKIRKIYQIFVESVKVSILLFYLLTTVALRSMKVKTNLDLLFCLSPTFQKSNADPVSTDVCKSSIESFFTKSFQYVLQTIPTNISILLNITGLRIYLDVHYST